LNWPELRKALLKLPKNTEPITIERLGIITNENVFLKTHIKVVDNYPQISPRTEANNRARLLIAKPHFDRLMAYYLIKTQL
jgi:hypothetical protein